MSACYWTKCLAHAVHLPLERLSGVALTFPWLQGALHGRVAHLLLVARHQPATADLRHQAADEAAHAQCVRVVRSAEMEGQALLVEAAVEALGRAGPQELRAQGRLATARTPYQQHPPGRPLARPSCSTTSSSATTADWVGGATSCGDDLLAGCAAGHIAKAVSLFLEAMLDLVEDPLPAVKALPLQQTG